MSRLSDIISDHAMQVVRIGGRVSNYQLDGDGAARETMRLNHVTEEKLKALIDGILFESDEPDGPKSLRNETDILYELAQL